MIKGLHHVAIAVRNLDDTARFYSETFGLPQPETVEVVEEQGVRACLISLGNAYIELLEPTRDDSAVGRFLARSDEGLHHICLETDDVAAELRIMEGKGLELVDRVPRHGLAGLIGFLHPRSTRSVLIEFVQVEPGRNLASSDLDASVGRALGAGEWASPGDRRGPALHDR